MNHNFFYLYNLFQQLGVIKPLFVSLDLPYSIIRGEEFVLQANVFNYFDTDLRVKF